MGALSSWEQPKSGDALGRMWQQLWPRRQHGRRRSALGLEEGGNYTIQTSKGEEGIEGEAHGECSGGLGELGEATERAHGRRRSRWPEVEEDGGEGVRVRPASLGLVRRSRTR